MADEPATGKQASQSEKPEGGSTKTKSSEDLASETKDAPSSEDEAKKLDEEKQEQGDPLTSYNSLPKSEGGIPADDLARERQARDAAANVDDPDRQRIMEEPGHGEGAAAAGQVEDSEEAREENEKEYEKRVSG
jgi:hypothetical protein